MLLSVFNNKGLWFAMIIDLTKLTAKKYGIVDSDMALEQIIYNIDHYFISWNESCCQLVVRAQLER